MAEVASHPSEALEREVTFAQAEAKTVEAQRNRMWTALMHAFAPKNNALRHYISFGIIGAGSLAWILSNPELSGVDKAVLSTIVAIILATKPAQPITNEK